MAVCSQLFAEQHGRLDCHADAFSDDRMRLGGCVADVENSVIPKISQARPDWSGCEPCTFGYRIGEYRVHAFACGADVRENCRTRYRVTGARAACSEIIAPDTTGQTDGALSGVHHAAVTTRKSDQWHEILRQSGTHETRLESEQIRCMRGLAEALRW